MTKTVPPTSDTGELTGYAVTAAELRRIAAVLDTLPLMDKPPYVQLSILTGHTAEAVDVVAMAVLRKPGKTERISGDWYHLARGSNFAGNVHVTVQTRVPAPPDERDAEIDRLRAELAEAHAATATAEAHLGTNGAVAEAKPDTLMIPHGEPHRTVVPICPTCGEPHDHVHMCAICGRAELEDGKPFECPVHGADSRPEMQTRPQCSRECMDEVMADGKSHPGAGWHHDGCPNALAPGDRTVGGE